MSKVKKTTKYSREEVKAYYMGQGAAVGYGKVEAIRKFRDSLSPALKKSFSNGFDDAFADRKIKLKRK